MHADFPIDIPRLDPEIGEELQRVRRAFREGRGPGESALFALERLLARKLAVMAAQASAVADANVRAVELVEKQEEISTRLDAQNRELAEQTQRIEQARAEAVQLHGALPSALGLAGCALGLRGGTAG